MTSGDKAKQSRINLRISPEQKELLERAAFLKGLSISAYLLSNSLEAARKDIECHEKLGEKSDYLVLITYYLV